VHARWRGVPQRVEDGRQFYRLGPMLQERADKALAVLLSGRA